METPGRTPEPGIGTNRQAPPQEPTVAELSKHDDGDLAGLAQCASEQPGRRRPMVQGEIRCPCRHSRSTALPSAHAAIIPAPQTNDNLLLCHWTRLYSQAVSATEVTTSDGALVRPGAPKRPYTEARG